MATQIHPTAIVAKGARLGADVSVGPYCVIGEDVSLDDGVALHAHVVIAGRTMIGAGTKVFPFASLGHAPQDLKYGGEDSELIVGKNNVIREHVTMNAGTEGGGMKTVVGDNGLFMTASHVAHDCHVGNNVILANNATLGGHVTLGDHCIIGGLSAVHQFVRIGAYAIIGGVSAVVTDIIPFSLAKGDRAALYGLNLIGLERGGFSKEQIRTLQRAYNQLFADRDTWETRLEGVEREYGQDSLVQDIVKFARAKTRFPICRPKRSAA